MHGALGKLGGDFARREIGDFHAVEAGNGAAIVAGAARLDQFQPGAREESLGVLLQASLRRHGKDERRAHAAAPALPAHAASSSIEAANPTAGIGAGAPSLVSKPS